MYSQFRFLQIFKKTDSSIASKTLIRCWHMQIRDFCMAFQKNPSNGEFYTDFDSRLQRAWLR